MPKTIRWLVVLLAVQVLMALGLNFSNIWFSEPPGAAALVAVAQNQINRIVLEGPEQTKVVLIKEEGTWRLPEAGKFPADSNRVNRMLERLTSLKTGTPIATTAGAKTRFKVNDESFERRITLGQGDKTLTTLYIGSSPGLRRSYARADGEDSIFALELAAYEVPVQSADWEDKTILQLPKADIVALELVGLRFGRSTQTTSLTPAEQTDSQTAAGVSASVWEATGLDGDRHLNLKSDAIDKLARLLADLTIEKVLGQEIKKEYGLDKPVLTITLTRKGGSTFIYRLGKNPNKEEYTLKVSNRPEYFRLPSYKATALLEAADRKQLLDRSSEADAHTSS